MAETQQKSDVLTLQDATTGARLTRSKYSSESLIVHFVHTQVGDGDANSLIRIARVPGGARLLTDLSTLTFGAFGASRTLDIGWEAYTQADGTAVVADPNGIADGIDVSGVGRAVIAAAPTSALVSYLLLGTAVLTAQVLGGTIPDTTVVEGVLFFTRD